MTVIPPDSVLVTPPPILEGRWLRPTETGAVVMTEGLADVRSGDTVQLALGGRLTNWQVVGIVESAGHGGDIFTTEAGFAFGHRTSAGLHTLLAGHCLPW